MSIQIYEGDIRRIDLKTRMPFKYGIATMTECPHVFVRLRIEVDGKLSNGISADHLPPKWFKKDANQPIADEIAEMARVIDHAVKIAIGMRAANPFALWRQLYEAQAAWGKQEQLPPLLTHFGTSLVERAMIDAFCRAYRRPFHELLRHNEFQIRHLHPPVVDAPPVGLLSGPREHIVARHTVGLADPIADGDIAAADRLNDGLPQSLEACVQAYGLHHFKIKLSGAVDRDRERLETVARVLESSCPAGYACSLDGNEQFRAADELLSYWAELAATESLGRFFRDLLFLEQPFQRDVALAPELQGKLSRLPPMIIDESDSALDSLPRALALGYAGTSHKNCKGVFRSICNECLLREHRQADPSRSFLMSGEDLANIGPVALLQDLAVCSALGIRSVERNGHHYFAGLSMFPREMQRQMLEAHGDLYQPSRDGWPTLMIRDGMIRLDSVNAAPFGVGPLIDVEQFKHSAPPG